MNDKKVSNFVRDNIEVLLGNKTEIMVFPENNVTWTVTKKIGKDSWKIEVLTRGCCSGIGYGFHAKASTKEILQAVDKHNNFWLDRDDEEEVITLFDAEQNAAEEQ